MFDALDISSSALQAQRTRMDTIADNIANMNTTHDKSGKANPFRRRFTVFAAGQSGDKSKPGVHVQQIAKDTSPFRQVHEPGNPDADKKTGNVLYPNVDLAMEYVNAMESSRAYEANVTAMEVTKSMLNASLRLLA